jgi:hypothetical protein
MADIALVHRIIDRGYLGQPGISQTGEGMRESAELTLDYVRRLKNTEVRLVEAGGFPGHPG